MGILVNVWDFLTDRLLTIYCFVRRPGSLMLPKVPGVRSREYISCQSPVSLRFEHLHVNMVCVCMHACSCVFLTLYLKHDRYVLVRVCFHLHDTKPFSSLPQKYTAYHKLELHNEGMEKEDSDDKISFFKCCKCLSEIQLYNEYQLNPRKIFIHQFR